MSNSLKDLEVHTPLGNLQPKEIGVYTNVSQYKKLGLAFYSDAKVSLVFTASHDSIKDGPKYVFNTTPKMWETATLTLFLPYIKLDYERIGDAGGGASNELIVVVNGHHKRGFTISGGIHNSESPSVKPKSRRWSFLGKGSSGSSGSEHKNEPLALPDPIPHTNSGISTKYVSDALPALILPNTLFVGGKGNKIVALPPGTPGQVLQFTSEGIKWT